MAHPRGESGSNAVRLDFDRRLMLQFRGSLVTSDAGLLAYRELDDAIGLTVMAGDVLADARSGKNGRHALAGLFRRSVFGRLAGYEDVNDAERLRHDPAMRWIVGGKAAQRSAALQSQMGCFETQWLAEPKNFAALADRSGQWIDLVYGRRPPRGIVLDMDSSVSPTHGEEEMSVWNGHYACTAITRCSCSTSLATSNAVLCVPATCTALTAGTTCSSPSWRATRARSLTHLFSQFPAHAGDAGADQGLVADESEGKADQDRREGGEPRPLCYLPDGRGRHRTANVPRDFAAHRGATAAATTSASVRRSMSCIQEQPTEGVRPKCQGKS